MRVRGHLIKFDEDTLNTFLNTPMVVEEGENLCVYSMSQPTLRREGEARLTGASSKKGIRAESPPTFI